MARIRPKMADWRRAQDLLWLASHGDSVYPISNHEWVVFPPDGGESDPMPLEDAIRLAREMEEKG